MKKRKQNKLEPIYFATEHTSDIKNLALDLASQAKTTNERNLLNGIATVLDIAQQGLSTAFVSVPLYDFENDCGMHIVKPNPPEVIVEIYLRRNPSMKVRFICTDSETEGISNITLEYEKEDWSTMKPYAEQFMSKFPASWNIRPT